MPQLERQLERQVVEAPSLAGMIADLRVYGRVKRVSSTFRKLLRDVTDIERVQVRASFELTRSHASSHAGPHQTPPDPTPDPPDSTPDPTRSQRAQPGSIE